MRGVNERNKLKGLTVFMTQEPKIRTSEPQAALPRLLILPEEESPLLLQHLIGFILRHPPPAPPASPEGEA